MRIVSRFPYLWPHLGFALAVGDNEIDESKIPLAAHAKLAHLSKPGRNAVGEETPAPISGYEPSKRLTDAAEKHARRPTVKPAVQTLESLEQTPAAGKPAKVEPEQGESEQAKRGEQRR